jgi:hypothetical protein
MPFVFSEITTPAGRPCLLIEAAGRIELEDAKALEAKVMPGAPYYRCLAFTRAAKGTEYSTAARKYFPSLAPHYSAISAVAEGSITRAAINLMVRFTRGKSQNFRMFASEAEALVWLDERASLAGG